MTLGAISRGLALPVGPAVPQVAVAGGGLVGLLLAWRLAEFGLGQRACRVTLFDGSPSGKPAAAHTAAAMISPLSELVVSDRRIYDMGLASLRLWPQWLAELNARIERPTPPVAYSACGSLALAHAADQAELRQFAQELRYHLADQNPAQWLNQAQLQALEPHLASDFAEGLFLPDEAFLDNRALLAALRARLAALGVRLQDKSPVTFNPEPVCEGVAFDQYDLVVDARGVGSLDALPVRGVRGEVLWVSTPEVQFSRPIRLMHPRYKLYIVPKPNHQFIVGATEIESSDASPVSVQSVMELCSALYTLNPAFAEARIQSLESNLRPSLLDNMPCVHFNGRILRINGLYRHGYLLAPCLIDWALSQLEQA